MPNLRLVCAKHHGLSALLLVAMSACNKHATVASPQPAITPAVTASPSPPPATATSALEPAAAAPVGSVVIDTMGGDEAIIVAVVKDGIFQQADAAGPDVVRQLAPEGARYEKLPSLMSEPPSAAGEGKIAGPVSESCGEYRIGVSGSSGMVGFGVVGASGSARTIAVHSEKATSAQVATVAKLIEQATRRKIKPVVQQVYRVDLDGDGKLESILQATHPALLDDPPETKPGFYSLLAVLSDDAAAKPVHAGYLQAARRDDGFEVFALDAVADVDLDGKPELLVRSHHLEQWHARAFRYDGELKEIFHSVSPEQPCDGQVEE